MLSEKMNEALNVQANRELYSSYLYLSMSYYFESTNMKGFANWMRVQAGEELVHAMMMLDYVVNAGGRAKVLAVEAPRESWASPKDAFGQVWDHERAVTGLIRSLVGVAEAEKDEATRSFLQWYVDEQVEEEESSDSVLKLVLAAGNDDAALQAADRELGHRSFKFPKGFEMFPYAAAQGIKKIRG
ncbi:MAG: ferritin [Methanothrix sp.]|nr:ferritin [Methanothrix sp.]